MKMDKKKIALGIVGVCVFIAMAVVVVVSLV